jgi:rubrerythrin
MKKITVTILCISFFAGLFSYAGDTDKTIANLKAAFIGESTASAKYAAYAAQARKENLINIAIMFEATSKAEAIHATNHKTVLEKMGQKADPVKPTFNVKTTAENLKDALDGETYEINTMYPGFITTAKAENATSAVKSFTWAMDTEKKHQAFYKAAIDALSAKTVASLPKIYWVCPKCGNTFNEAKPAGECGFCGTSSEKYIKFDK